MRRSTFIAVAFILGLGIPAASIAGPSIKTDTAPGVNFSAYKTYSWLQANVPSGGNPVMYQRIVNDFDAALASKGYQSVPTGGDLSLIVTIGAQQKTDVQSWGRWGLQTSVYQYTQGQLSLDAFDAKTKQPVWHGQASETIGDSGAKPEKVDEAVTKMMSAFPPTAAPPAPAPQH